MKQFHKLSDWTTENHTIQFQLAFSDVPNRVYLFEIPLEVTVIIDFEIGEGTQVQLLQQADQMVGRSLIFDLPPITCAL